MLFIGSEGDRWQAIFIKKIHYWIPSPTGSQVALNSTDNYGGAAGALVGVCYLPASAGAQRL